MEKIHENNSSKFTITKQVTLYVDNVEFTSSIEIEIVRKLWDIQYLPNKKNQQQFWSQILYK